MEGEITTNQISKLKAWVVCAGFVIACSCAFGASPAKANYSGKYSLQGQNKGDRTGSIIEVIQSDDSIEITTVDQDQRTTNRYPLNGSEGPYTSPSGLVGTCKAQLKDKYLVLESMVRSRPQPNTPAVRVHTKERWQLSSDSKTLTVKSDVDFPDVPYEVSSVVGESVSGTQKYTRV